MLHGLIGGGHIIADEQHLATGGEGSIDALADRADPERTSHAEVVADNDSGKTEIAAQYRVQPVGRVPGRGLIHGRIAHMRRHDGGNTGRD